MAKILKRGFLPASVKPWPIGETLHCDACGCKWEIETNNDFFRLHSLTGPVNALQIGCVRINCPTCGRAHQLKDVGKA